MKTKAINQNVHALVLKQCAKYISMGIVSTIGGVHVSGSVANLLLGPITRVTVGRFLASTSVIVGSCMITYGIADILLEKGFEKHAFRSKKSLSISSVNSRNGTRASGVGST